MSERDAQSVRPMTPEALREIADWLDTYDRLAGSYFDLLEHVGLAAPEELGDVRVAAAGKEVQSDLRAWAAHIEGDERG